MMSLDKGIVAQAVHNDATTSSTARKLLYYFFLKIVTSQPSQKPMLGNTKLVNNYFHLLPHSTYLKKTSNLQIEWHYFLNQTTQPPTPPPANVQIPSNIISIPKVKIYPIVRPECGLPQQQLVLSLVIKKLLHGDGVLLDSCHNLSGLSIQIEAWGDLSPH